MNLVLSRSSFKLENDKSRSFKSKLTMRTKWETSLSNSLKSRKLNSRICSNHTIPLSRKFRKFKLL